MSLVDDFRVLANDFTTSVFADATHTFLIKQKSNVSDGQGGYSTSWYDFAVVTGFVKTLSTNEIIKDDRIKSDIAKQFSFEYLDGITPDMKIVFDGVDYNILPFDDVMNVNVWQKITAYKDEAV